MYVYKLSVEMSQTGEVPTKRKNKAYAVIKNEMEERERAKKRVSKNMVRLNQKYGLFQTKICFVSTKNMVRFNQICGWFQ